MQFRSLFLAVMFSAVGAQAEVKLPPFFSSHMVLQRDKPVPVWGTATAGEKVTVKFRGQEKTTTAGADGKWMVKLDPLKAGGPDVLTVNAVTVDDVLVGEVWVGSGQSNMAGLVDKYAKDDPGLAALVAGAPYLQVRQATAKGGWQVATSNDVTRYSAILFAFGLRLHQELNVPVGLMLGAVGGTPSGYWLSPAALQADAACQAAIKKVAATYNEAEAQKTYEAALAQWKLDDAAAKLSKTNRPPRPPSPPAKPGETEGGAVGHLYEKFIQPLIPYAIRGVLWDQGEAGTKLAGVDQYTLMGALIRGWRKEWGQDEFPFLYVQKPSGGGCAWDYTNPVTDKGQPFTALPAVVPNDGGAVETHVQIMTYPNTGMAISSDLGNGVHPTNKSGYGHRAADVALGMVYGRPVEYYGPVFAGLTADAGKLRVRFTHVGKGLAYRHGDKLQGFAVAGADKVFHWADAVIEGDTVVLSSAQVPKPVAVRYAWSNQRTWANLFNQDGLPAIPFRAEK